jgi:branched-chain amino acid transport system permease protein
MDLAIVLSSGLLIGGIYAFIAIGLNLIFGVVRVANFAQGEFVMLGMFVTYLLQTNLKLDPYISAWLIIAPLGFILGALVYVLIIRRLLDDPNLRCSMASAAKEMFTTKMPQSIPLNLSKSVLIIFSIVLALPYRSAKTLY